MLKKIKIDQSGHLHTFRPRKNGAILPLKASCIHKEKECGDWCPFFNVDIESNLKNGEIKQKSTLKLCGKNIEVDEVIDERV